METLSIILWMLFPPAVLLLPGQRRVGLASVDTAPFTHLLFLPIFPFQVTSTWQVWPKACTATSQSSWPPGMASRAAWRQWTWMGACQTSSTMPSTAVGRSNVAVKVPPVFLSCSPVASLFAASASAPSSVYLPSPPPSDPVSPSVSSCLWLSMSRHVPQAPGMHVGTCPLRVTLP